MRNAELNTMRNAELNTEQNLQECLHELWLVRI